jgi:ATP-dependent protease ClpP protease subunit
MYFNAKEAKEYGIVSNIIKSEKEIKKLIEGLK